MTLDFRLWILDFGRYSIRRMFVNNTRQATTAIILPPAIAQVASGPNCLTKTPDSGAPRSPVAPVNPNEYVASTRARWDGGACS